MMAEEKALRQAENRATIVGVLVEKNLEEKTFTREDGTQNEAMTGEISVRTGENEVHRIRFFANKYTRNGEENRQYKALQTVNNEYISVADAAEQEGVTPSIVRVTGRLALNEYYGQDGELKQYPQIEGAFVTRLKETDDLTPIAQFNVEGIVNRVAPEFDKNGDETDRAVLELLIPGYQGRITPLTFVVEPHGKDFVLSEYTKGASVRVYGNIVNRRIEHKKVVEMGFGDPIEEVSYEFKNEYVITGGSMPYDEDSEKAFDLELVKKAMQDRQIYLEQLKNKNKNKDNQQRNTFGNANAEPKAEPKNSLPEGIDLSSLF